jgi:hypothetical protein
MKRTNIYKIGTINIILLLFVLNVNACSTVVCQNKQERKVPAFNELKLSISANVILNQGPEQKVEIVASDESLNLIETEVVNGTLSIKWTEKFVTHVEKITIYITMVDIKGLVIAGSGDIIAQDKISAGSLNLSISGSGKINLNDLSATDIKASIAGSADISISGSSQINSLEARISGSGKIIAPNILVKNVDISISGSGDCTVNASESLDAKVSGSGNVYYSGSAIINAKVSGSGKIKKIN